LDITPEFPQMYTNKIDNILSPGKLLNVGSVEISGGGSVTNTGLGMKILGADVSLMGKIGDDAFGDILTGIYRKYNAESSLIRQKDDSTSYSMVLAIPGIDRIFLHHTGANDTFCADDIRWEEVGEAALFHFGYPPLMRRMYEDGGVELEKIFAEAQQKGAATSLDLAAVDPDSAAGKADWIGILTRVLPQVDFFCPSIEELCYMLDPVRFAEWKKRADGRDVTEVLDLDTDIKPLADTCMKLGAKVLLVKCGAPGMYLRTSDEETLQKISGRLELNAAEWADQDFFEKSYVPDAVSGFQRTVLRSKTDAMRSERTDL
jgi:sugar/nucleoside kinase (ribokinase family)